MRACSLYIAAVCVLLLGMRERQHSLRYHNAATTKIQYLSSENGKTIAAIVPIKLWRDIELERETAYLLSSPANKKRLMAALKRGGGTPLKEVRTKLGI